MFNKNKKSEKNEVVVAPVPVPPEEKSKEEVGTRLANQNLLRAQLASIPDIMLRGGEGVADIYSKQAQNTLAWASNLPKYNLPAMNYTALRNYGLG